MKESFRWSPIFHPPMESQFAIYKWWEPKNTTCNALLQHWMPLSWNYAMQCFAATSPNNLDNEVAQYVWNLDTHAHCRKKHTKQSWHQNHAIHMKSRAVEKSLWKMLLLNGKIQIFWNDYWKKNLLMPNQFLFHFCNIDQNSRNDTIILSLKLNRNWFVENFQHIQHFAQVVIDFLFNLLSKILEFGIDILDGQILELLQFFFLCNSCSRLLDQSDVVVIWLLFMRLPQLLL